MMKNVVIVSCVRTAVGRAIRGTLSKTRPDDLAAEVFKETVKRTSALDPAEVDDVILGCAFPESSQGMNIGRRALVLAGLPNSIPGQTVNRLCASGLQAIATGTQQIMAGMCDTVLAGGTETMSLVPMMGFHVSLNPNIVEENPEAHTPMGITAENVADKFEISRGDQDVFAYESNQKALAAIKEGRFAEEILPFEVKEVAVNDMGERVERNKKFEVDEGPRKTTLEKMATLKPAFRLGGTVTAGNSSQMSDGAAAVLLMSEEKAAEKGLEPLARFVGFATAGCPPELMGIGPIYAIPRVMKVTGMKLQDMDLIELNEAFASQALACIRHLDLDLAIINVNGGAIALGHPLGCTGAKLTVQIIHEMIRRKARYGLVSMCIGGGMGAAGIFENLRL
jgi:acetyl-CoA acyltransferase